MAGRHHSVDPGLLKIPDEKVPTIQGVTASRRRVRKSEGPRKHIAPATEDWVQGRRGEFIQSGAVPVRSDS